MNAPERAVYTSTELAELLERLLEGHDVTWPDTVTFERVDEPGRALQ